jgi:hypothetical protein
MHNFGQIVSGHVSPFFITELLQKKGNERLAKSKMLQQRWKHIWKSSVDGILILNK